MVEVAEVTAKTVDKNNEMTHLHEKAEKVSLLLPLGDDLDDSAKVNAESGRVDRVEDESEKCSLTRTAKEMGCVAVDDYEDSENIDKSTETASSTSDEEVDEKRKTETTCVTKTNSIDNDIEEGFEVIPESHLFSSPSRFAACSKSCRRFWLVVGGLAVLAIILVAVRKSQQKSNKQKKRFLPPPWDPPVLSTRKCDPQGTFCYVVAADLPDCLCNATPSSLLVPISAHDPTSTFMPSQTTLVPLLNKNISRPIPTNAWWSDLLISKAPSVWTHPYRVRLDPDTSSLMLSYPAQHRVESGMPNANGGLDYFFHSHTPDWKVLLPTGGHANWTESLIEVTDWNDLGVSTRILGNTSDSHIQMPLVRGMAFLTLQFSQFTPVLQPERKFVKLHGATSSESIEFGEDALPIQSLRPDRKWIMELENNEIWILYSDREISWQLDPTSGVLKSAYTTYPTTTLRFARLPNGSINEYFYDRFQNCIVTGGTLHVPEGSTKYAFEWTTDGEDCQTSGLLHFALPHHLDQFHEDDQTLIPIEGLVLSSTTYGMMQAYESWNLWSFYLDQNEVDSSASLDFLPMQMPDEKLLDSVNWTSVLEREILEEPWDGVPKDGSYYFNGKAIQKYATLCLLARQRETMSTLVNLNLLELCISKLDVVFRDFIQNTWTFPLVYDGTYGGIVSSRGLVENNTLSDFGNSVYNDHHYHWGYWIVASAIFRELVGPSNAIVDRLARTVECLIRDVATPNHDDPWFPRFRQFDWYLGHSLSRGLVASADGKDQESTSEEMNFHYGMFLWGRVSKNPALEQLGTTLLKANARSIQSYYLFSRNNTVHPPAVTNNRVAGVIFENKLDYSTWFCGLPECIHGIHMIPVIPAYPMFRSQSFIQDEWEDVLSNIAVFQDDPDSSWLSLLYINFAHVNATLAMETLPTLPNFDTGLSRSWALYYSAVQAALEF
jgi:endo-1,3(4)-beta-glucanase